MRRPLREIVASGRPRQGHYGPPRWPSATSTATRAPAVRRASSTAPLPTPAAATRDTLAPVEQIRFRKSPRCADGTRGRRCSRSRTQRHQAEAVVGHPHTGSVDELHFFLLCPGSSGGTGKPTRDALAGVSPHRTASLLHCVDHRPGIGKVPGRGPAQRSHDGWCGSWEHRHSGGDTVVHTHMLISALPPSLSPENCGRPVTRSW